MGQNVDAAQVAQQIGVAIANAVAAAAPPAVPAPPAAAFALTPALATTGVLDYGQKAGSETSSNRLL